MSRFAQLSLAMLMLPIFSPAVDYAEAAPIYSQVTPAEPFGAFSSQDKPSRQKIADNFLIPGLDPITVRSLRFIGGYGLTSPPPSTPPLDALPDGGFRVVFFEDFGGNPGSPIVNGDIAIGSAFIRTPTNGPLLNGVVTPLEFRIDLGQGITLSPETEYWISITNDPGPEHFWSWARASGVLDDQTAGTRSDIETGPWNVFTNGGMWFELNDENIPEPNSLSIAALTATSVFLLRNRRRSLTRTRL